MPVLRLEELSWGAMRRCGHQGGLFMLPVSPLEDHGPHLPAGVDLILSQSLCAEMARAVVERAPGLDVVLCPPLPLGASRLQTLGCLRVEPATLLRAVEDLGRQLDREGVRKVAVISAHVASGHIAALEEACSRVSRSHRIDMVAPSGRLALQLLSGKMRGRVEQALGRPFTSEEWGDLGMDFHGGAIETSLMLRYRPDLVAGFHKELPPHRVDPRRPLELTRKLRTHRGYFGAPAAASKELAEALAGVLVAEGASSLLQFVRGELHPSQTESGFRRVPLLYWDPWSLLPVLAGAALGFGLGQLLARPPRRRAGPM